jgi:hypothetical protein
MSTEVGHACYSAVGELPPQARALFEVAGQRDFQASAPWFENFLRTVELKGQKAEFHLWREDGRVLALLPLLVQQGPLGCSVSALGNYYTTRWAPLLAENLSADQATAALQQVLAGLLRKHPVHTLNLGPLQADSAPEQALQRALRGAGFAVWHLHSFQNWLLPVRQSWPDYLAARDGKLRTTIARMGKRFTAKGGHLELLQGGPRLEAGIAAYEAVYAASWKDAEPHPQFMPGMIRAAAALGQLRLALAWLGDKPVAAQVWMVAGGRADIYKLAHDEAHKETSPGTLLTTLLMQHAFEVDNVQVVDYLSGDDAYKRLWMSEVCERRALLAYNLRQPRGLALAARQTLSAAVKRLRPRPATGAISA